MLRLTTLMNVCSYVLADAAISPYRKGEIPLASDFIASLADDSVTMLDEGFFSADLLLRIQDGDVNRHQFIPQRKRLVYTELERYGDGDCLLQMKVSSQARKKSPVLLAQWQVRVVIYEVGSKQKTVLTSLPVDRFSAAQVSTLYHERWEIELGFRDIKS